MTDTRGHTLYKREKFADLKGKFAFTADEYDIFEICISNHAPIGAGKSFRGLLLFCFMLYYINLWSTAFMPYVCLDVPKQTLSMAKKDWLKLLYEKSVEVMHKLERYRWRWSTELKRRTMTTSLRRRSWSHWRYALFNSSFEAACCSPCFGLFRFLYAGLFVLKKSFCEENFFFWFT